jgi:hypothetical protein
MGLAAVEFGPGAGAVFTGRHGGGSTGSFDSLNLGMGVGDDPAVVGANRAVVASGLGVSGVAWMRQVHGRRVADVTGGAEPGAPPPEADALVTDVPGLALAVLVADCAPVLLADPAAGLVGAAHSGRNGTALGVVPALVAVMRDRGADPARMRAAIGPMVCGACYEVPAALRDEVAEHVPAARATTRSGTPSLDLRAGILAQLRTSGVTSITVDGRCTVESPDLYSYRRDGRTGRFAGYVWVTP